MIRVKSPGSFNKSVTALGRLLDADLYSKLDAYGRAGVEALRSATPVRTGLTAASWDYEIVRKRNETTIHWVNYNQNRGTNIAIILQYGHGTGTGGWVAGRDYINPAIQPVMDQIAADIFSAFKV